MEEDMVRKGGDYQVLRVPQDMALDTDRDKAFPYIGFTELVEEVLLRSAFECMMCVGVADKAIGDSLAEEPAKNLKALFEAVAQNRAGSAIEKCLVFALDNMENYQMPASVLSALRAGVDALPIEGIVEFAVKQIILSGGNRGYGGTSQIRTELKRLKTREYPRLNGSIWSHLISAESSELTEAALAQVKVIACAQSSYCEEFCRVDLGATQATIKEHFKIGGAGKPTASWWPFRRRT